MKYNTLVLRFRLTDKELWTLLDWTNPGHVGSLTEWKNKVAIPLRVGQSHDANNKQLSLARVFPLLFYN